MRGLLVVQSFLQEAHEIVEFLRLDDGPRENVKLATMELCDEVSLLFVLHYLLELAKEPEKGLVSDS